MNDESRPQPSNVRPGHREAHAHASEDQPFHYPLKREFAEPDWTRLPGYRDVTKDQWVSAQWQRAHSVKNLKEFKEALGEFLDDDLLADIEADQRERATMSMLLPPQMINTMEEHDLRNDRVRRYMAPALSDREAEWASHPMASRDSPARGRDVGGRGTHAPLPHEGPRGADPDLPAVLRALHADGPRGQRHAAGPEVQVRDEAERAVGPDARLPAADPAGPRRRRAAAATWRTSPSSASRTSS